MSDTTNQGIPEPEGHADIIETDYEIGQDNKARADLELLRHEGDLCVGENEPYAGHLPGDAVDRHALGPGRANALIELRHDLITDPVGQHAWAERLAPILEAARKTAGL